MSQQNSCLLHSLPTNFKMRFFICLLAGVILVAEVRTFGHDFADLAFKKYAMIKIFEDCVGKEEVAKMFKEMKQACTVCSSRPAPPPLSLTDFASSSADGASAASSLKQNRIEQQTKSAYSPNPMPIFFSRPFMPQPLYGFPYYPSMSEGLGRSTYGPYPSGDRFMPNYMERYNLMMPNPGFFRRARQVADEPEQRASDNQPIMETNPLAAASGPVPSDFTSSSIEKYLLLNPKAQKLFGKLHYKIANMTCILQELRFLGADMQPDYDSIKGRIQECPMDSAVKADLLEGVDTCKDFSQCVPIKKMSSIPMLKDLARPCAFMECLKRRKIEACMKKDLREKVDSLLGTADWATARQSEEFEDERPQAEEIDMFNTVFGFDVFSSDYSIF